jgi:hypothetical protein
MHEYILRRIIPLYEPIPKIVTRTKYESYESHKETKGRSGGQTPFTLKPKQLALKKAIFNSPKILPNFVKQIFHFSIKQLFSADPTM